MPRRWEKEHQEISEYLGLKYPAVSVRYREEPDPAGRVEKLFGCTAIRRAFRGRTVNLERTSLRCPGSVHWLGFDDYRPGLVMFLTHGEKLFASEEVTERWFESIPPPRSAPAPYLVLKPLELEEEEPELVLFLVNAHQAHRIHSILIFREGTLSIPHHFGAICQEAIANPISLGQPAITLPETTGREFGGFDPGDIIVSLPLTYFLRLYEDLRASDGGKESFAREVKNMLQLIK